MNADHDVEVQRIDAAIRESGAFVMNEADLSLLFADGDSGSQRFPFLARLAREREWSFEFHPHDGEVRISLLPLNGLNRNHDGA